jgi:ABC-2 type transport system permease protein
MGSLDWGLVASRLGLLVGLVVISAWFATRAFGVYQRSL